MYKFKIGGKVTISKEEEYFIVDIIEYKGEIYYFASSLKKPVFPIVFQKVEENNDTYLKIIEEQEIISYIVSKVEKGD